MKKMLLTAFAVLGFMVASQAQENVVKVNPLALLGGSDLISYERYLSDYTSGIVSGAIGGYKIGGFKYKSAGAGLQYRYYFSEVLRGWYGGAIVDYQSGKVETNGDTFVIDFGDGSGTSESMSEDNSDEVKFSSFGGGLKFGYQWLWDSGFSLDLNIGASYKKFNYEDGEDSSAFKGSGLVPTLGFGLGYAF